MATAKKLEFQAERKAAAWQGGKPQPAPLPTDVHAATCLVDSDGEAARTAYPVFPGIEIAYHDVHAASAATQGWHTATTFTPRPMAAMNCIM